MNNPDIKQLPGVFAKIPYIEAVYLFGSSASGKTNQKSDIDLAIVLKELKYVDKKLYILTELAKHGFCHVDLIFFEDKDIVLEFEAIRHNCLIYATKEFDKNAFFSKIIRKYFDFYPYLKNQREAYKNRLLDG